MATARIGIARIPKRDEMVERIGFGAVYQAGLKLESSAARIDLVE